MRRSPGPSLLLFFFGLGLAACGAAQEPVVIDIQSELPVPLIVVNRSQYPVLELYVHRAVDFAGAPNRLERALPVDEAVVLEDVRGVDFLTYVRTERDLGDRYSISTETPLGVNRNGFAVWVFDEGFRLLLPEHPENTPPAGR